MGILKTSEKSIAIVRAALDGGWLPDGVTHIEEPYYLNRREVSYAEYHIYKPNFSFPAFIFDPEAMFAIYGDEKVCVRCGGRQWCSRSMPKIQCYNCPGTAFVKAFVYHQMQAIKLSGGDYKRYLYFNLPNIKEREK